MKQKKYEKLCKKHNDLDADIIIESCMLTAMFTGKANRKRKEAIKLLKLPSYGHDILRSVRKVDKLLNKKFKIGERIAEYEEGK